LESIVVFAEKAKTQASAHFAHLSAAGGRQGTGLGRVFAILVKREGHIDIEMETFEQG
jgi:hypothetical protein